MARRPELELRCYRCNTPLDWILCATCQGEGGDYSADPAVPCAACEGDEGDFGCPACADRACADSVGIGPAEASTATRAQPDGSAPRTGQ